ncbi:hypothetical protein EDF64_104169 [Curtobacterium flaccumfaciens]|uniref:Uncharacterized protein n=1 Tax=Curtobacterium flaccumfaciens TaxID=2035 RepID=A0A4R6DJ04_9MICO|nr:hypothetical protein [Curtobacterium flaccumfaciens]TDN44766.1 hypothetical protein EDF64_104169 [Curtobacterium flaccumfaciens]
METALIGAVIAAGAAIVAAVVSWFGAFQSRRATDRDHAWQRFTWAVAQPDHDPVHDISITVLRGLADVAWWSKADRRLADRALRRRAARLPPGPATKESD